MSRVRIDVTTTIAKLLSEDCYQVFLLPVMTAVCSFVAYYSNWLLAKFGVVPFLILFISFVIILAMLCTCNKFKKKGAQKGRPIT